MHKSRLTIFSGHYGSGKTTIAVNYALWLRNTGVKVTICDLDIVNPYFRTADSIDLLNKHDIELITSEYANSNLDMPAVHPRTQSVFDNKNIHAVIDLGGDNRGALALGRYAQSIADEGGCEMLLVINKYRPLTRDIEKIVAIKNEIEEASNVMFTGIVNNSNLGGETTVQTVLDALSFADELSNEINLPVKMTVIDKAVLNAENQAIIENVFPIEIYKKKIWKI